MKNLFELLRGRGSHRPDVEALSAYLDRRLTANDAAVVESHAAGCAVCSTRLAGLREVRATLRAQAQVAAPRSFRLRVADVEARSREPMRWANPLMRTLPMVGVAAAAVFLVAVVVDVRPRSETGGRDLAASRIETSAMDRTGGFAADDGVAYDAERGPVDGTTESSSGEGASVEAYAPAPSTEASGALTGAGADAPPEASPAAPSGSTDNAADGIEATAASPNVEAAKSELKTEDDGISASRLTAIVAGLIAVATAGVYVGIRRVRTT